MPSIRQIWSIPVALDEHQVRLLQAEARAVGEGCMRSFVATWIQTLVELQLLELANDSAPGELANDWYENVYCEPGLEDG